MIPKQRKKKHPKTKQNEVVDLIPDMTKDAPLPQGFKTAEKITKVDELEHECGRLRSYLATFSKEINIEGKIHFIQVDPLNMTVKLLGKSE